MTSTASKPKNYTSLAFKRAFKGTLVNTVLALGASVVSVIIAFSSTASDIALSGANYNHDSEYFTVEIMPPVVLVLALITGFFSLTTVPRMFRQIYKKQSCDSYFSVPIKREEYFVANYFYGFLVNIVCFVLPLAVYLGAIQATKSNLIDLGYVLKFASVFMLAVLSMYSMFVVCAVISGKRIQYLILSLICLFCTSTMLTGIATKICSIWGFSGDLTLLNALSPIDNAIAGAYFYEGVEADNVIPLIIISLVEIIGLFIAGYIAFKKRKAETAESSLSGKVIPYVILAILVGAAFFFSATGTGAVDIVVGIVLATLMAMAFSGIFYKKVFTKQTLITLIGVCTVFTTLSIVVTLPVFNGYVKYVPEAGEVDSVEFCSVSHSGSYTGFSELLGTNVGYTDFGEEIIFVEQENIEKIIALHNKSIEDDAIKTTRKKNNRSWLRIMLFIDSLHGYNYIPDTSYRIKYNLADGSTVERVYSVSNNLVTKEYYDVFQNEEALWQLEPMSYDNEKFLGVECSVYNNGDEYLEESVELVNFDIEQYKKALVKDYLSMQRTTFISEFDSFESAYYGMYYGMYYDYDEYYPVCNIDLYFANDDITDEELAEYKKMPTSRLLNAIYEDYDKNYKAWYFSRDFSNDYTNTVEYLNSCGANLN
ncbi:MAG: hypothetical protein PUE46_02585 [Eubacteriales bacterium]|nr:hypothetical protein [Eubacteriales bacterium]